MDLSGICLIMYQKIIQKKIFIQKHNTQRILITLITQEIQAEKGKNLKILVIGIYKLEKEVYISENGDKFEKQQFKKLSEIECPQETEKVEERHEEGNKEENNVNNKNEEKKEEKEIKEDSEKQEEKKEKENLIEESKEKEKEIIKSKEEIEKENVFKLLEKKSEVLRRYLSENVLPLLSLGILQVATERPDDPVEALADFLLDKTLEMEKEEDKKKNKKENETDLKQENI